MLLFLSIWQSALCHRRTRRENMIHFGVKLYTHRRLLNDSVHVYLQFKQLKCSLARHTHALLFVYDKLLETFLRSKTK